MKRRILNRILKLYEAPEPHHRPSLDLDKKLKKKWEKHMLIKEFEKLEAKLTAFETAKSETPTSALTEEKLKL